jgi:hypothetical protein
LHRKSGVKPPHSKSAFAKLVSGEIAEAGIVSILVKFTERRIVENLLDESVDGSESDRCEIDRRQGGDLWSGIGIKLNQEIPEQRSAKGV